MFKAQTVEECWVIARDAAEYYQEKANWARDVGNVRLHDLLINRRDAADDIARRIKYGESRPTS